MASEKTSPPTDFGPVQAPRELGMAVWEFDAALRRGLIPPADRGGRWSAEVIADAGQRCEQIRAQLSDGPPIGAGRAAGRLTERLDGITVSGADVAELAERGHLVAVDDYKGHPLYDRGDLDQAAAEHATLIAELVAEREGWELASCPIEKACAQLGWSRAEFVRVARQRGFTSGRFARWALTDIEALAADEELDAEIRGARLLGPDQAAEHLQIRRRDFDYLTAAGFVTAATYVEAEVGRRRYVTVAMYTTASIDDLLDIPGIDWEQLRGVRPGALSPLREFTRLPIARATLVRGLAADLSDRHGIEVAPRYDYRADTWRLHWTPGPDGEPGRATVAAEIASRPELEPHRGEITLHPADPTDQERTA